jgi:hypothetical protein
MTDARAPITLILFHGVSRLNLSTMCISRVPLLPARRVETAIRGASVSRRLATTTSGSLRRTLPGTSRIRNSHQCSGLPPRVKNPSFVGPPSGLSPAGNLASVPDCSQAPFYGTARGVPKKGSFDGVSEIRYELM